MAKMETHHATWIGDQYVVERDGGDWCSPDGNFWFGPDGTSVDDAEFDGASIRLIGGPCDGTIVG